MHQLHGVLHHSGHSVAACIDLLAALPFLMEASATDISRHQHYRGCQYAAH